MSALSSWIHLISTIRTSIIAIFISIISFFSLFPIVIICLTFLTPALLLIFCCFLPGSFSTSHFGSTLKTPIFLQFFLQIYFSLQKSNPKHQWLVLHRQRMSNSEKSKLSKWIPDHTAINQKRVETTLMNKLQ